MTPPSFYKMDQDLQSWIPRLLQAWRRRAGLPGGPADSLRPEELGPVAANARKLSRGLTGNRGLAGADYFKDAGMLGAYLLCFWPVSYAQARRLLAFLPGKPVSAADLGAGPGPCTAALWDAGASHVASLERNPEACGIIKDLAQSVGQQREARLWSAGQSLGLPPASQDAIMLGHVVNELWPRGQEKLKSRLNFIMSLKGFLKPGGSLVILEPALMESTREILELRDKLVQAGAGITFPCLYRQGCPVLKAENLTCHLDLPWTPPRLLMQINKAAGMSKPDLKMTGFILNFQAAWPDHGSGQVYRIVSEPLLSKSGRTRLLACGVEGRLSLSTSREELGDWSKVFFNLRRGDLVKVEGVEKRESGFGFKKQSHLTGIGG